MTASRDDHSAPDFEIDHLTEYGQYFVDSPSEIAYYLNLLIRKGKLLSVYIDGGARYFLTALLGLDEARGLLLLDPASDEALNIQAKAAGKLTLTASLNRVKMQFRLPPPVEDKHQDRRALAAPLPDRLLRLQRREYFRLQTPVAAPLRCRIELTDAAAENRLVEWGVADISAGGVSLMVPMTEQAACRPDTLLENCRLEIPNDGVVLIHLRVRKVVELSTEHGLNQLRVGCKFVNVPASRLAVVERYITRIERQRTAKFSGLAD